MSRGKDVIGTRREGCAVTPEVLWNQTRRPDHPLVLALKVLGLGLGEYEYGTFFTR